MRSITNACQAAAWARDMGGSSKLANHSAPGSSSVCTARFKGLVKDCVLLRRPNRAERKPGDAGMVSVGMGCWFPVVGGERAARGQPRDGLRA